MTATMVVVSDLHLADGDATFEQWGDAQQAAFERLLAATAPGGELASESVELIINGDCFDFLLAEPNLGAAPRTDVNMAHAKWTRIASAHEDWLRALRRFLERPGRRLTFLLGNHDLELLYPSVRARIRSAIRSAPGTVRFCLGRAYAPAPDVHIEHGCQFDGWNILPGLWEKPEPPYTPAQLEVGDARGPAIGPALLPWGSRYYTHVFLPYKHRFPYLDRMVPDLSFARQIALVCLLAPDLARAGAVHTASILPDPAPVLAAFADVEEDPLHLFGAAIAASAAVMQSVGGSAQGNGDTMAMVSEINALLHMLSLERSAALEAILTHVIPSARAQEEIVIFQRAAHAEPATRLFVVGHTHYEGRWPLANGGSVLNTGTWVTRYGAPTPETWFADLGAWFSEQRQSGRAPVNASRFISAWLRSDRGAATVGELIAWGPEGFTAVPDDVRER